MNCTHSLWSMHFVKTYHTKCILMNTTRGLHKAQLHLKCKWLFLYILSNIKCQIIFCVLILHFNKGLCNMDIISSFRKFSTIVCIHQMLEQQCNVVEAFNNILNKNLYSTYNPIYFYLCYVIDRFEWFM